MVHLYDSFDADNASSILPISTSCTFCMPAKMDYMPTQCYIGTLQNINMMERQFYADTVSTNQHLLAWWVYVILEFVETT